MTSDQPVSPVGAEEIDLLEMFAALQRRWRWFAGGGLLGLVLSVGPFVFLAPSDASFQTALIVDVAQGPCFSRLRQVSAYKEPSVFGMSCRGEFQTMRQRLRRIAGNNEKLLNLAINNTKNFDYKVGPLELDRKTGEKSSTQIALTVTAHPDLASDISAALAQIQKKLTLVTVESVEAEGFKPFFGLDWIRIDRKSELDGNRGLLRALALGLLGGLVTGVGSALIVNRCSNRVFSLAELLRRLGHPLRLGLPAGRWTDPSVQVLVGQLATELDQNLAWRVLSIARQHEAVAPLTQLLQQYGGTELKCTSADPLLSAVLHFEPRDKPAGLLLVVESGFNSARALEGARLLIGQMSTVRSVGVVLIGMPMPAEFSPLAAG